MSRAFNEPQETVRHPEELGNTTTASSDDKAFVLEPEDSVYVEDYHIGIKIAFAIFGCVSLVSSILAIIAMGRTKKTPANAKIFGTCLLLVDGVYVVLSSVRKFIDYPLGNTTLQSLCYIFVQLEFATVAIMTVERLFLFYRPMRFLRFFTWRLLCCVVAAVWGCLTVMFLSVRYGVCYAQYRSFSVFNNGGRCNMVLYAYFTVFACLHLLIVLICNFKICLIIRKKSTTPHTNNLTLHSTLSIFWNFKTTSLVLLCSTISVCSLLSLFAIQIFSNRLDVSTSSVLLHMDAFLILNCFINTFLYVLWFKECQMELLNMFAFLSNDIKLKVFKMKLEIYDIVTYNSAPLQSASPALRKDCENKHIDISVV